MMARHDDEAPPAWNRQPGEPSVWFSRFVEYRMQTPPRSAVAVYRSSCERRGAERNGKRPLDTIDCLPESWAVAKKRYEWIGRAAAFDDDQLAKKEIEWAAAREEEREEELRLAREMRVKAHELLALPVKVEQVRYSRNGEEIEVFLIPEHRAFQAAAALAKEAMRHSRAALEMPDKIEKREHTGSDGGPITVTHGITDEERLAKLLDLADQAATAGSVGLED